MIYQFGAFSLNTDTYELRIISLGTILQNEMHRRQGLARRRIKVPARNTVALGKFLFCTATR
jgi:hypothetical protein